MANQQTAQLSYSNKSLYFSHLLYLPVNLNIPSTDE